MEFSYVSRKRRQALVACLDAENGVGCATHAIASTRDAIGGAVADLARRERAPEALIGAVCLRSDHAHGASGAVIEGVRTLCVAAGWAGAVWTDLSPNFADHLGEAFSIPRATAYLRTLTDDSLDEAVRYIENAPAATDTPLRRALAAEDWWQAEAARLGLG